MFEDSVPGVEAGRRAGMRVVWCPHPALAREFAGREAEVLAGLVGASREGDGDGRREGIIESVGWPSQVGDGWGDMYATLEDFPYAKYGIVLGPART